MTRRARDGAELAEKVAGEMQSIASTVSASSGEVSRLVESTREIESMAKVIKDIADQTNLLALNAAIEAARAGEQGRGFAVVADEVRKLAERTTHATGKIGTMIAAIQSSARAAVDRMGEAVNKADASAGLARNAGQSIEAIRDGANQVASAFNDMVGAIAEQSSTGQMIAQQVEQVTQASEGNKVAMGQTAEAARTLEALSRQMRQRIEQFRV